MDTCLSSVLFSADFSDEKNLTRKSYGLTNARDAGFKEDWLQRAIAENCELVLAPCRAAGLIDENERWACWHREVHVEPAGDIDVLLISESGRVAIVETKLAYNPEARREVVAQVLEYAIHLPSSSVSDLPPIPNGDAVHPRSHDVENSLREGDYLLIIAGDELDPRAIKLSEFVLGHHLVRPWDLALVEVAVFQPQTQSGQQEHLLVPHLRGVLAADQRQVVTVKVEGGGPRVTVENLAQVAIGRTPKWTEGQFFAAVERAPAELRDFTRKLQGLRKDYPELTFDFGASKQGSLLLKKDGASLLALSLGHDGGLSFRTKNDAGEDNFVKAFGEQWGLHYRRGLEKLVNRPMESGLWFGFPSQADKAEDLLRLLREALNGPRSGQGPLQTAAA
jgi:hypothetical protein